MSEERELQQLQRALEHRRQTALNDLYRAYRIAGDDDMNARCRILTYVENVSRNIVVTQLQLTIAQASYGDPDDLENMQD